MMTENETIDVDLYPERVQVDACLRSVESIDHLIEMLTAAKRIFPRPARIALDRFAKPTTVRFDGDIA